MTEFPLQCSRCGGLDLELLAGEELLVESLELEDAMTTEGMAHGC
jgi:Zn finger protein HypA/HybF involved in hydrogenase expression